jgi:hypothetical protein
MDELIINTLAVFIYAAAGLTIATIIALIWTGTETLIKAKQRSKR